MKIIVIGAGAWGTALAVSAARNPAGHHVVLWARDGAQAEAMDDTRENARYLPGIPLPRELNVRGGDVGTLMQAVPQADLIQRGGFPPVHLAEINFQSMYEQQNAAQADASPIVTQ